MWAGWECYLTANRDVLGLRLSSHDNYYSWEQASIHGGFRIVHEEFCIVSDFPSRLRIDEDNRPHCEDGPSHLWRDGWALYYWHGVNVTEQIICRPQTLTVEQIRTEMNVEVRRVMIERIGWERYCQMAGMKVIHRDSLESAFPAIPVSEVIEAGNRLIVSYRDGIEEAELVEATEIKDFSNRPLRFVRVTDPSTGRQYTIRVAHNETRCYAAIGSTFGMTEKQYKKSVYKRQGDVMLKPLSKSDTQQAHS